MRRNPRRWWLPAGDRYSYSSSEYVAAQDSTVADTDESEEPALIAECTLTADVSNATLSVLWTPSELSHQVPHGLCASAVLPLGFAVSELHQVLGEQSVGLAGVLLVVTVE